MACLQRWLERRRRRRRRVGGGEKKKKKKKEEEREKHNMLSVGTLLPSRWRPISNRH